jgi:hypothetical protein
MRKTLTADVTNATTTSADVTGLSFPVTSGRTYRFKFTCDITTDATTTGIGLGVNGPAMTRLVWKSCVATGAATETVAYGTALDTYSAATTSAATAGNYCTVEGICTPSADGNVILRNKSEVAVASGNVVKAGSCVEYDEVK